MTQDAPLPRHSVVNELTQVVVKVGTRVVCDEDGRLSPDRVGQIADQLSRLVDRGLQVVLVSSGAVGAGMSQLGLASRPADVARLQAVAAIGQARLIEEYERHLSARNRHAAQMLLISDDLDDRTRYLNVRNTLLAALELNAIPIVNENDTVAVEELLTTFGDNDRLAARVTNMLQAQMLIVLTDVDGLFDGDPKSDGSRVITNVTSINDAIQEFVCDDKNGLSRGGMRSKLDAARECTLAGKHVILANGHTPDVLIEIVDGAEVGTLFRAEPKAITPLKRWIGFAAKPKGLLTIDEGACRALCDDGRSLLPIGVRDCTGNFNKGDVVSLVTSAGVEVARGVTNYSHIDVKSIAGKRSDQIADVLGHCPYEELVHRDNLLLVGS